MILDDDFLLLLLLLPLPFTGQQEAKNKSLGYGGFSVSPSMKDSQAAHSFSKVLRLKNGDVLRAIPFNFLIEKYGIEPRDSLALIILLMWLKLRPKNSAKMFWL